MRMARLDRADRKAMVTQTPTSENHGEQKINSLRPKSTRFHSLSHRKRDLRLGWAPKLEEKKRSPGLQCVCHASARACVHCVLGLENQLPSRTFKNNNEHFTQHIFLLYVKLNVVQVWICKLPEEIGFLTCAVLYRSLLHGLISGLLSATSIHVHREFNSISLPS